MGAHDPGSRKRGKDGCEFDDDDMEFIRAVDTFRRVYCQGRPLRVLQYKEVFKMLGYEKQDAKGVDDVHEKASKKTQEPL